jgi:hypothetical protein
VPCCNFWLRDTKLGRDELLGAIEKHHAAYGTCERALLDFRGPHNRVLVLRPARMVSRELGEPVSGAGLLVPARRPAITWAARARSAGAIVVKVRYGDRAYAKTQWCASHLPALGARGYPVPAILWHGMISAQWHVTVQNRLPCRPLHALDGPLNGPKPDALLRLVAGQPRAGLVALAVDYEQRGDRAAADLLLARLLRRLAMTGCAAWSATG